MTDSTALAVMDDEFLAGMGEMVDPHEDTGRQGPPTLKINYDADSVHPCGEWVLGQRKNAESEIIDEGVLIQRMIILTTRCRWSYYDSDNPENSFNTGLGMDATSIPDKTEFFNRANELGLEKGEDYKFQTVIYGLAVYNDEAGETKMTECVMYQQGSSLTVWFEYLDAIKYAQNQRGQKVKVPRFAFFTKFGESIPKKYGSIKYYIPTIERGEHMPKTLWEFCYNKRQEAYDYIDDLNSTMPSTPSTPKEAPAVTGEWEQPTTPPGDTAPAMQPMGDVPDWTPPAAPPKAAPAALPAVETAAIKPPATESIDDFDISSVVAAIKGDLPTA